MIFSYNLGYEHKLSHLFTNKKITFVVQF